MKTRISILCFVLAVSVFGLSTAACRGRTASYIADVTVPSRAGMPQLSGKLYLSSGHIRVDWGTFADVFDIKQRTGWRILDDEKMYQELGSKDLSTYAPEMTNGSLCPNAQVPSQCKLLGTEAIEGRKTKKWDVLNPQGFHVYFWTDEELGITLRMSMGEATSYEVLNLHRDSITDTMFQLPNGYQKLERPFKP